MDYNRKFLFSSVFSYTSKAVWLAMIVLSTLTHAQNRTVIKDSLTINDSISGIREFQFDKAKGSKVYDGKFNFQSVSESKVDSFDYKTITYKGEYASDIKHGDWSYSYKHLKQIDKKVLSGLHLGNLASGTDNTISGTFYNGKAAGNWQVVKQNFIESEIEDTLFLVQSTFKNNRLVGSLQAQSPSVVIEGYFNADGYFHGTWEVKHTESNHVLEEYRTYNAGVLESYEIAYDGKTYSISFPSMDSSISADEVWVDLSLQDDYFEILNLVDFEVEHPINSSILSAINSAHHKTNQFIKTSLLAFSFNSERDIWRSLKGSEPLVLGKFKVRKFEFSAEEKKQIEDISNRFETIKTLLKKFKDNPKVKIGKPVYEKLNEVELIFNVYRNKLNQLNPMVRDLTSKGLEYVNRQDIYSKIRPQLRFPVELTYEFQSELVTKPHQFPKAPERDNFDLAQAQDFIKNIETNVVSLNAEASEIFESMETEKNLSQDEEKLVKRKDEIETLFNTTDDESYNTYHQRYSSLVLKLTEKLFNDYGNSSLEIKKHKIKPLLACFADLKDFYTFLEVLKTKDKRLNDEFTRTTFNPYMLVDMSERIKENIYTAFDDSLKPYLFQKLEDDFNCKNLNASMEDINKVYQKMMDLSKQDTKEEEKQLKKQKNPEVILSVLELELQY